MHYLRKSVWSSFSSDHSYALAYKGQGEEETKFQKIVFPETLFPQKKKDLFSVNYATRSTATSSNATQNGEFAKPNKMKPIHLFQDEKTKPSWLSVTIKDDLVPFCKIK